MELDRRYVVNGTEPDKIKHSKAMASKRALDKLSPTKFGAGAAEHAHRIWKINKGNGDCRATSQSPGVPQGPIVQAAR